VSEYDGKQFVGIDLHRHRSVIVRQTAAGEHLATVASRPRPYGVASGQPGPRRLLRACPHHAGNRQKQRQPNEIRT
jgi:hypothetical protein